MYLTSRTTERGTEDIDFLVPYDEKLLKYLEQVPDDTARRIGRYVSNLIEDGSTIQIG
jgi:hypothetical protein